MKEQLKHKLTTSKKN